MRYLALTLCICLLGLTAAAQSQSEFARNAVDYKDTVYFPFQFKNAVAFAEGKRDLSLYLQFYPDAGGVLYPKFITCSGILVVDITANADTLVVNFEGGAQATLYSNYKSKVHNEGSFMLSPADAKLFETMPLKSVRYAANNGGNESFLLPIKNAEESKLFVIAAAKAANLKSWARLPDYLEEIGPYHEELFGYAELRVEEYLPKALPAVKWADATAAEKQQLKYTKNDDGSCTASFVDSKKSMLTSVIINRDKTGAVKYRLMGWSKYTGKTSYYSWTTCAFTFKLGADATGRTYIDTLVVDADLKAPVYFPVAPTVDIITPKGTFKYRVDVHTVDVGMGMYRETNAEMGAKHIFKIALGPEFDMNVLQGHWEFAINGMDNGKPVRNKLNPESIPFEPNDAAVNMADLVLLARAVNAANCK